MAVRRKNPIDFTVAPGAREGIDMRRRTTASMFSPIKQRAVTERALNTPHNYHVMLLPRYGYDTPLPQDVFAALLRPNALTLAHIGEPPFTKSRKTVESESIYTAFTYLHRLGDEVRADVLLGRRGAPRPTRYGRNEEKFPISRSILPAPLDLKNPPPDRDLALAVRDAEQALLDLAMWLTDALAKVQDNVRRPFGGMSRHEQFDEVTLILADRVNSQMVREGYALDPRQAESDLFALAELTPPARPLLRPYAAPGDIRAWHSPRWGAERDLAAEGIVNLAAMEVFNAYMAQHNTLWRHWHDLFIRANYGAAVGI